MTKKFYKQKEKFKSISLYAKKKNKTTERVKEWVNTIKTFF